MRFLLVLCGATALVTPGRRLAKSRVSRFSTSGNGADERLRLAALISVPVAWGTYAPAVRYIYSLPVPPPGVVFSAAYYVVALATLAGATALARPRAGSSSSTDLAGLELGGYLFCGNVAQVVGLQTTTADAAAVLVQLTTILVPLPEPLVSGRAVKPATLRACALAFAGVLVICGDGALAGGASLGGDALILLAAVFYSAHVLRLTQLAPREEPLQLALSKAKWETVFALATVATLCALQPAGDVRQFLETAASGALGAAEVQTLATASLWCGAVTCAYTIWAQSFGQRDFSATNANLIYTSQPVFSALFAAALLDERPTAATILGGSLIITAVASNFMNPQEPMDPKADPLV